MAQPESGGQFERVAQGVAVVEQVPLAGIPLVLRHDPGLEGDAGGNLLFERQPAQVTAPMKWQRAISPRPFSISRRGRVDR
ncbi:hypothetical protein GCM10018954_054820 [Kutzneria kofuensis]